MQRVHGAGLVDRAGGGDERLAGDLATEHSLALLVGGVAAEDVDLDRVEVEEIDEVVEGGHVGNHVSDDELARRRPGHQGVHAGERR